VRLAMVVYPLKTPKLYPQQHPPKKLHTPNTTTHTPPPPHPPPKTTPSTPPPTTEDQRENRQRATSSRRAHSRENIQIRNAVASEARSALSREQCRTPVSRCR